ncbi:hypothetical protein [Flavobacterium faecale]|uniref:hypothetical protein n=1 Tax=Flavobacterium faecale TaxID=1355330 RepID=UPI003AADA848
MYNFIILSKSTKSSEHLSEKDTDLHSFKRGKINFEEPWNSSFLKLTEEEWKELEEKGKLTKTEIVKKTTFISK